MIWSMMVEKYTTSVFLSTTKPTVWGEKEKRMKKKKTQEGKRPIYGQFANTNTLFSYDYKPP